MNCWFQCGHISAANLQLNSQFLSTAGLLIPVQVEIPAIMTDTERDMLEVLLKWVNVFVYKCVY